MAGSSFFYMNFEIILSSGVLVTTDPRDLHGIRHSTGDQKILVNVAAALLLPQWVLSLHL